MLSDKYVAADDNPGMPEFYPNAGNAGMVHFHGPLEHRVVSPEMVQLERRLEVEGHFIGRLAIPCLNDLPRKFYLVSLLNEQGQEVLSQPNFQQSDDWTSDGGVLSIDKHWSMEGLVAYYPFEGNANDYSGQENHIEQQTPEFATDRYGKPAAAWKVSQQALTLPDPIQGLSSGPRTFAAWVRLNQTASVHQIIFSEGGDAAQNGWRILLRELSPGHHLYPSWTVMIASADNHAVAGEYYSDGQQQIGEGPLSESWGHLLISIDPSGESAVFLNGYRYAMETEELVGELTRLPEQPLVLGYALNGGYLDGQIDDVRIYNRALSDSEARELYVMERPAVPVEEWLDVTAPGDTTVGTSQNSPPNEQPHHAIDDDLATKYLNFDMEGSWVDHHT